jgi:hypothetical protein
MPDLAQQGKRRSAVRVELAAVRSFDLNSVRFGLHLRHDASTDNWSVAARSGREAELSARCSVAVGATGICRVAHADCRVVAGYCRRCDPSSGTTDARVAVRSDKSDHNDGPDCKHQNDSAHDADCPTRPHGLTSLPVPVHKRIVPDPAEQGKRGAAVEALCWACADSTSGSRKVTPAYAGDFIHASISGAHAIAERRCDTTSQIRGRRHRFRCDARGRPQYLQSERALKMPSTTPPIKRHAPTRPLSYNTLAAMVPPMSTNNPTNWTRPNARLCFGSRSRKAISEARIRRDAYRRILPDSRSRRKSDHACRTTSAGSADRCVSGSARRDHH